MSTTTDLLTENADLRARLAAAEASLLALQQAQADGGASRLAALNLAENTTSDRQAADAAAALRESETRLRLALEAADFGTWDLDLVTGKAVHSLRHDQIFGYPDPQPEWSLEIALRHILPEDRQKVQEAHTPGPGKNTMYVEARMRRADGSLGWVMSTGRFHYDDQPSLSRALSDSNRQSSRQSSRQG